MKKNKWLYLTVFILVLASLVIVLVPMLRNLQTSDKNFAVEDVSSITRIVLTNTEGDSSDLTFEKGEWSINHQYKVRKFAIQNLLETLKNVKVDYPVSKAGHNNVIKDLMQSNVHVQIFTGGKKPSKTFYVGGPNVSNTGTFMIMEHDGKIAERPYVTSVLGGAGYLTGNFSAKPDDWRTREIFAYASATIKSIKIEYMLHPEGSFEINNDNINKPTIIPLAGTKNIDGLPDTKRLIEYIGYFNSGYAENFINEYEHIDTFLMTVPYCLMTITDSKGTKNLIRIYHKPVTERTKKQFDEQGNPMTYDTDKYIAAINHDKEFALIQFYSFGKFFKKYFQFFGQPSQPNASTH